MRIMNIQSFLLSILLVSSGCQAQNNRSMTTENTNPLLCDPEKGMCEIPAAKAGEESNAATHQQKPVKIVYFTDPICSSCWGIEPQLRKLKLEYGSSIEIEYRMGGLLPDWSYNSGGISKPSDVAHHWDEVSQYYNMPIDGDVWLEDPLSSSYPPSIACKAAQLQDEAKASKFMRRIREMVFLEKKNITKWEHIADAAEAVGLDAAKLKKDFESQAKEQFQADLALGRSMGVRGFPTLFFSDSEGNKEMVYGSKPYAEFEKAVLKLDPKAVKQAYSHDWESLFAIYPTLTLREFSELSGQSATESQQILNELVARKKLTRHDTKNGSIWKSIK